MAQDTVAVAKLLLSLFVRRVLVALLAVLRELNLALYKLLVLTGVVVGAFTNGATQLDEVFAEFRVGHGFEM